METVDDKLEGNWNAPPGPPEEQICPVFMLAYFSLIRMQERYFELCLQETEQGLKSQSLTLATGKLR